MNLSRYDDESNLISKANQWQDWTSGPYVKHYHLQSNLRRLHTKTEVLWYFQQEGWSVKAKTFSLAFATGPLTQKRFILTQEQFA